MRTVQVKCTFTIPVEIPDDPDFDAHFYIEENHCVGTGNTGLALEELMAKADQEGFCWACYLGSKCEIVES